MKKQNKLILLIQQSLAGNTEFDKVEFKDARGGIPSDLWRPISAFSNTNGGTIFFGVKEDTHPRRLTLVGSTDLATLQEKIVFLMEQKMKNHGLYKLTLFEYENVPLLALVINETSKESKPCYQEDLGLPRGACIRVGNVNQQISDEELKAFLRYSPEYKHDRTKIKGLNLDSLSIEKIKTFLQKSAQRTGRKFLIDPNIDKVMRNIGIVDISNNRLVPTIAGFLLFSKDDPQDSQYFSRYIVRCVRYSGTSTSSEIIDKRDIFGTLDKQVEDTYLFIVRNINVSAKIVDMKMVERPDYPLDAIREIVANSLIHRDYMITGTYVNISVFSDRVEISNPGNLPPGITIENLKDSQFSRNEVIAKIMRDLDFMEEYGRGIDLVYARMKEWNLPEPLFKNKSNMFKVTLLGNKYSKLNLRQLKIWHFLQDNFKITASEAHGLFEDVSRPTINNDLKEMVKIGLLDIKGASNNTYYEAKY